MFISARRVAVLWEKAPINTVEALKVYHKIVKSACSSHNCYVARVIGESYLVVSDDPCQNFKASGQIQQELNKVDWYKILTGANQNGDDKNSPPGLGDGLHQRPSLIKRHRSGRKVSPGQTQDSRIMHSGFNSSRPNGKLSRGSAYVSTENLDDEEGSIDTGDGGLPNSIDKIR